MQQLLYFTLGKASDSFHRVPLINKNVMTTKFQAGLLHEAFVPYEHK